MADKQAADAQRELVPNRIDVSGKWCLAAISVTNSLVCLALDTDDGRGV